MFDPFFAIGMVGGPIAILYLFREARMNANSIPTVGTCLTALLAGYGVFVWLEAAALLVFGESLIERFLTVRIIAAAVAALVVGIPFALTARARRARSLRDLD